MDDIDAYKKYPHHHKWFNKLWLSEKLGYRCGLRGYQVIATNEYIVRPIMNLEGMGVGAKIVTLTNNPIHELYEKDEVPPGHFWCEKFEGRHFSYEFKWEEDWQVPIKTPYYAKGWRQLNCWEGFRELGENRLWRWSKWKKCYRLGLKLPDWVDELKDVGHINVECIDDNIIEIHLRPNCDPIDEYLELIVWWKDTKYPKKTYFKHGYVYIESYDDAGGQLPMPRLGFLALPIIERTRYQNDGTKH